MKLEQLVSPKGLTEYAWRLKQAHMLELAIAQAPDKGTRAKLEREKLLLTAKIRACEPRVTDPDPEC